MRDQLAYSLSKVYRILICSAILIAAELVAIPVGAQNIKMVSITYTDPASGQQMYKTYCAPCHGITGNGPAATAFKHPPTNLTKLAASHDGKLPRMLVYQTWAEGRKVTAHGNANMPVWGDLSSRSDGFTSQVPQNAHKGAGGLHRKPASEVNKRWPIVRTHPTVRNATAGVAFVQAEAVLAALAAEMVESYRLLQLGEGGVAVRF